MQETTCDAGDPGSIPGLGRSPGGGNGFPLQYSAWRRPWTEEPGGLEYIGLHRDLVVRKVKVTKLCPALCDAMDCSPSISSVHGIFQARILEQVAISYSRASSQPRDQTRISWVSCIGRLPPVTLGKPTKSMPVF